MSAPDAVRCARFHDESDRLSSTICAVKREIQFAKESMMMMRNIPFPFLLEETLETIAERAHSVAGKAGSGPVRLSRQAIESRWTEITEHKWYLSERLGRDVGNQVAAIDYLENIARISGHRYADETVIQEALHFFRSLLERMAETRGIQALSQVQAMMHGLPDFTEHAKMAPRADLRPVRISARRMATHRDAIEEHKWFLGERLGRDVGSKTAAVDYFENVRKETESLRARFAAAIEDMMEASGPNSIANLERALRARTAIR